MTETCSCACCAAIKTYRQLDKTIPDEKVTPRSFFLGWAAALQSFGLIYDAAELWGACIAAEAMELPEHEPQ